MRKFAAVILIAFVAWLGWIAWCLLQPPPGPPRVSVRFLGYTNDATGQRLALITITNLSKQQIFAYLPNVQLPAPTEPMGASNYFPNGTNQFQHLHATLDEGASTTFTVQPPAPPEPWRISFFAYNDFGTVQMVKRIATLHRNMPFTINGDWINADK